MNYDPNTWGEVTTVAKRYEIAIDDVRRLVREAELTPAYIREQADFPARLFVKLADARELFEKSPPMVSRGRTRRPLRDGEALIPTWSFFDSNGNPAPERLPALEIP